MTEMDRKTSSKNLKPCVKIEKLNYFVNNSNSQAANDILMEGYTNPKDQNQLPKTFIQHGRNIIKPCFVKLKTVDLKKYNCITKQICAMRRNMSVKYV